MTILNIYVLISIIVAFATTIGYNYLIHNDEKFYEELDNSFGMLDLKARRLLIMVFVVAMLFWIPMLASTFIEKIFDIKKED